MMSAVGMTADDLPSAEQTSSTKSFMRNMAAAEAVVSNAMFSTVFNTATAVSHPASACASHAVYLIRATAVVRFLS